MTLCVPQGEFCWCGRVTSCVSAAEDRCNFVFCALECILQMASMYNLWGFFMNFFVSNT